MIDRLVLPSTLILTLLLIVGLFFFVKASVKDRTQQVEFVSSQPEEALVKQLQRYFDERAYRVAAVDAATDQITFQGVVQSSLFLAGFLMFLVAAGLLCLALVLLTLFPQGGSAYFGLVLLAPLASWFYWQKAQRPEQVLLKVRPGLPSDDAPQDSQTLLMVSAHRDELIALQAALKLEKLD